MAQNRLKRQNTKYESENIKCEEEHFKLISTKTEELGLSTKYVDSLVKIEKFYIKLIKTILVTSFIVFPVSLVLYSVYQSFDTCNGLFGESVNVFWKYHKNYKKFNFTYEKFYDPRSEIDFYKYPWMVRIITLSFNKSHFKCSGFLITERTLQNKTTQLPITPSPNQYFCTDRDIATAAHCYTSEYKTEIHLSGTAEKGFIDSIIISSGQFKVLSHPKFSYSSKFQHDIALVKLNKPVQLSKTIHPIRLPFEDPSVPKQLTLTGWINKENTIFNPVLKEIEIPIFTFEECTRKANRTIDDQIVLASFQKEPIPIQFCGGHNYTYITPGDSGMPIQLMDEGTPVAYGIVSSGPKAGFNKPQIFTNLYPYLHWILCNAGDKFCKVPK